MRYTIAFILTVVLMVPALSAQSSSEMLASPDGRLEVTFQTLAEDKPAEAGGELSYSVSFRGKPLVEASALRLDLQGVGNMLGANVRIVSASRSTTDETYRLVTGKVSEARDHHNALRLELEERGPFGRKLVIEARAYDDAVAFRYVVPDQTLIRELRLKAEGTEFRIAKDATTYALILPHYRSMYESEFVKMPISGFSNQGGVSSTELIGLPLLMEVPGVAWMAITEADVRDYAAMYLENPSGSWTGHWFEARLSPGVVDPEIAVMGTLPHQSPWRVLMVGDTPGTLIESTVLTSLNPECQIEDTSWIKAGRTAWNWWGGSLGRDGKPALTTENMKYYADFAAESGFEYLLVDAGWSAIDDITKMNGRVDIPELVRYAGEKGVKVWIWAHWSALDRQLDEALPLYEKWGVVGVKVDFMSRDDQVMMNFYYRVAEKAAEHHIMMDYHGSTKPSGMDRMWPNVVGYESVLGMEQSKAGSRDNPDSHVMLPFTRMLVGQMDYTPGGFDNATKEGFVARMSDPMVQGTRAHHLAMYPIYDAPIQMVSDHPSAYEGQPSFQFLKDVPATWDETKFINGVPGEYITLARRNGDDWFLGSMTNWNPRNVEIPLTFLGEGRYTAEIYADAPDADQFPKKVVIDKREVNSSGKLEARMAPGGGYAVRFTPVR